MVALRARSSPSRSSERGRAASKAARVAAAMDRSVAIRDGRTSTEVLHAEAAEETVIIDNVGRLQIPRPLLEAIPFGGRARVHNAGDHIELWPAGQPERNGRNGRGPQQTQQQR